MTEEERYLFDLRGYMILRQVLSQSEVAAINKVIDQAVPDWDIKAKTRQIVTGFDEVHTETENKDPAKGHVGYAAPAGRLLDWGEPIRQLVGHKKVIPYFIDLIGPELRLDHQFAVLMKSGSFAEPLHGGNTPYAEGEYYHFKNNRIVCGLTVVSFALSDVPAGSGGFCIIPGSHKSCFPLPKTFQTLAPASECVVQVPLRQGDAVIFPEAVVHGAIGWSENYERRALIFKYCPGHMQWEKGSPYTSGDYDWEDHQRYLLTPPYGDDRERIPWPAKGYDNLH